MKYIQRDGKLWSYPEYIEKFGQPERIGSVSSNIIVKGNFDPYESPITGEIITTARQREQEMKAHGVVDYEPSLKSHIEKEERNAELNLEKAINETIEKEISLMPARKREKLESELSAGADLAFSRN